VIPAIVALARLTWLRLARGRTLWITALLFLVPIVLAALTLVRIEDPALRWSIVAELSFRSLVLLAPVLHLAPVIGEENEGKTYTYLWSRPVPRAALVLGKMAAIVPLLVAVTLVGLGLGFLLVALGPGEVQGGWLPRALLGAAAGVVAASCFAVGIGALVPRHPLVVCLAYIFIAEQILPVIPAVQNVSVLYHAQHVARLPRSPLGHGETTGAALLALALLSAAWLAIALWRVRRIEFGSADG
jgi:hypothetical protein